MAPKTLKDVAKENLTTIGDPVSVEKGKAVTEENKEVKPAADGDHKSLKEIAQKNPTLLGDPVSLKAEYTDTEPTENDRGAGTAHPQRAGKPKL